MSDVALAARPLDLRDALVASVALTLTPEQLRFLWLHARQADPPVKWRWHFTGTLLRAYCDGGATASIGRVGFRQLLNAGLMARSGIAAAVLTQAGRDAAK